MEIEQCIVPLMGKTVKFLDLHIEEELANTGIPLSKLQFVFLMLISKNDGQPQTQLAEITGRDKTTFTRNINTLERKNLVTRKASKKDKRIKLVYITKLGADFVQKSKPIISEIVTAIEADISKEDRAIFIKTLDKIKTKLLDIRNK